MIIIDSVNTSNKKGCDMPAKRRGDPDTLGRRIKTTREEKTDYSQQDMVAMLDERYGIKLSTAGFSKIELGDTKRLDPKLQLAIADILGVDVRYLLTGEETGSIQYMTEEAEEIARIVDGMPASMRKMMLDAAKATQQLATELLASQRRIAQLLEENIMLLENGDRSVANDYIASIGYHRNGER